MSIPVEKKEDNTKAVVIFLVVTFVICFFVLLICTVIRAGSNQNVENKTVSQISAPTAPK